ncbi:MAG: anti-sigma factor [Pedobacter sp.]|jgi:transmembrane sensor|nr:anti-sigma factor [Pedobacter sp.]
MKISQELIDRFFQGLCNAEEAEAVLFYFESDPTAKERYLGKSEWDNVSETENTVSRGSGARMLQNIRSATYQKPSRKISLKHLSVAALLLITAGAFLFLLTDHNAHLLLPASKQHKVWKSVRNTGNKDMRLVLEDGSMIVLAGHSDLSFPVHFSHSSRPLKLSGKALFKVAKDKTKPFVVFAGNTSTTALGTEFIVDSRNGVEMTDIRLLEGKVLVKVSNGKSVGGEGRILVPKQELIYSKITGMIIVKPIGGNGKEAFKTTRKVVLPIKSGLDISFNREPVSSIFPALELAYNTKINFSSVDMEDHYFTGSFHKEDTLERILTVIGATNNLEVKRVGSAYQIRKLTRKIHQ